MARRQAHRPRALSARWRVGGCVAALLLAGVGGTFMRAAAPADTTEFAFWRSGSNLTVTQVFIGRSGDRAALIPGARDILIPAGQVAALSGGSVLIPSGGSRAEIQYDIPFPPSGISVLVPIYTPTKVCFILAGEGVSFPVILNQAFFVQGTSEALGHNFTVYAAKGFSKAFRLNIERAPQPGGLSLEWLWLIPAVAIAVYLFLRLGRRHA